MTDREFLDADFDVLLQTMTVDEISDRLSAMQPKLAAHAAAACGDSDDEFFAWVESMKVPEGKRRKHCLRCGTTSGPDLYRCTKCYRRLLVVQKREAAE